MRVLIIDDDPADRRTIREALESAHPVIEFCEASSLAAADALIESAAPHLVVLDVRLPNGHGLDTVAHVAGHGVPMVVVTSLSDFALSPQQERAYGVLDVIAKSDLVHHRPPVLIRALARAIPAAALRRACARHVEEVDHATRH